MIKAAGAMADLETLGRDHSAQILSAGIVLFDEKYNPLERHHLFLCQQSYRELKFNPFHIEQETLEWWAEQGVPHAEMGLSQDCRPLKSFIWEVNSILGEAEEIWGNSPTFDLYKIEYHCSVLKIQPSWKFYQERDFRTVARMFPHRKRVPSEKPHDALADAEAQLATLRGLFQSGSIPPAGRR